MKTKVDKKKSKADKKKPPPPSSSSSDSSSEEESPEVSAPEVVEEEDPIATPEEESPAAIPSETVSTTKPSKRKAAASSSSSSSSSSDDEPAEKKVAATAPVKQQHQTQANKINTPQNQTKATPDALVPAPQKYTPSPANRYGNDGYNNFNKNNNNNNNKSRKQTFTRIAVDPTRQYSTPESRESWGPNVKGKKFRKEKGKKKRCQGTGIGQRIDGSVKSVRLDA